VLLRCSERASALCFFCNRRLTEKMSKHDMACHRHLSLQLLRPHSMNCSSPIMFLDEVHHGSSKISKLGSWDMLGYHAETTQKPETLARIAELVLLLPAQNVTRCTAESCEVLDCMEPKGVKRLSHFGALKRRITIAELKNH
jgi:hypothetical protein